MFAFASVARLAPAYGFAVTGTMVITTTYSIGLLARPALEPFNRETIMPGGGSGLRRWQTALYAFLARNASGERLLQCAPLQIIEIGLPVQP